MDIIKLNRNICVRSGKNLLRGMDGLGNIFPKFLVGLFYSFFLFACLFVCYKIIAVNVTRFLAIKLVIDIFNEKRKKNSILILSPRSPLCELIILCSMSKHCPCTSLLDNFKVLRAQTAACFYETESRGFRKATTIFLCNCDYNPFTVLASQNPDILKGMHGCFSICQHY